MRSARVAAVLDVCLVVIFVVIGRASHVKGESFAGIASTSWPFLCGLAVGWAASRAWRRPLALSPTGLAAWLCTVALGMILRVVSGQGTDIAFIFVALAFLCLFLLGWRVLARLLTRLRPPTGQVIRLFNRMRVRGNGAGYPPTDSPEITPRRRPRRPVHCPSR